eukprot:TRINITY_DN2513_c0_g1_i3.p1 TRINITY_DN2513_c0_g1~~TRINITY_DN2513_c0_g1_i3.p1  ORF type:complete len:306 (-),score=43.77 TRINITY_DN2513_c0_g1_i3:7-924(-)
MAYKCICDARIGHPVDCVLSLCDTYHGVSLMISLVLVAMAIFLFRNAVKVQKMLGLKTFSMRTISYLCGGFGSFLRAISAILGLAQNPNFAASSILFDLSGLMMTIASMFVCYMWTTVSVSEHFRSSLQRRILKSFKGYIGVSFTLGFIALLLKVSDDPNTARTGSLVYYIVCSVAITMTTMLLIRFYLKFSRSKMYSGTLKQVARVNLCVAFGSTAYLIILFIFSRPGHINESSASYVSRQITYRFLEFLLYLLVYGSFHLVTKSYSEVRAPTARHDNGDRDHYTAMTDDDDDDEIEHDMSMRA